MSRKPSPLPSVAELTRLFRFEPETGVLYRRDDLSMPKRWRTRFANKPTGWTNDRGYIYVGIGRKLFLAHRIIWKMMHGDEPDIIDHADGNPSNNRPKNLRRATSSQNMGNRRKWARKDLPLGVFRTKKTFIAKVSGIRIGTFFTVEEAARAYDAKAKEVHGEFAHPNYSDGVCA